jgi:AcrR family transcriptional regulator
VSTRERILEETLRLISKRGSADVSMGAIAAAAQLSRQAVYLHFRDRSDLLMALVRFVDVKWGIAEEVRKITEAPTGTAGPQGDGTAAGPHQPRDLAGGPRVGCCAATGPGGQPVLAGSPAGSSGRLPRDRRPIETEGRVAPRP